MTTNPVMSITDEQIAEIVRMNSELNELRCVVRYIRVDEVEALISRLRAAERDAERYRWLRERGDACQWMNIIRIDLDEFVCQDNALDTAIDTAMKGDRQ